MTAPARYHHGDLRAALIARATEVIATGGVDALSLRELARDIGVSHGAPGRHFPDKQALLDAVALTVSAGYAMYCSMRCAGAVRIRSPISW